MRSFAQITRMGENRERCIISPEVWQRLEYRDPCSERTFLRPWKRDFIARTCPDFNLKRDDFNRNARFTAVCTGFAGNER